MKKALVITGWCAVALAALIIALQVALSPKVCTALVNRYAPYFVDGELGISSASVSLFKRFPAVSAELKDVVVRYPSERYDSSRALGAQGHLVLAGRDTLASFSTFTARVNPFHLLMGRITLRELQLEHPRIFIHNYADGRTNLETIPMLVSSDSVSQQAAADSSDFVMPKITVNRLVLGERPVVVYTDQKDSLFALLRMKELNFDGRLSTSSLRSGQFSARLDSLMVVGRAGSDTLLFAMDHMGIEKAHKGLMHLSAKAAAFAATRNYGRVRVPIAIESKLGVMQSDSIGLGVMVKDMKADVATIRILADCRASFGDSLRMKGRVEIPSAGIQTLLDDYVSHFVPEVKKITTNATLSAAVDFDGVYDSASGRLPSFLATVSLPASRVAHSDYDLSPIVGIDLKAECSDGHMVNLTNASAALSAEGARVKLRASAGDLLGDDPTLGVEATLSGYLDSLDRFLHKGLGLYAKGNIQATLSAKARMSQLSIYKIGNAHLDAAIHGRDIHVMGDSLDFYNDKLDLKVALMTPRFAKKKNIRTLGADLQLDSIALIYKDMAQVRGSGLKLLAQCGTQQVKVKGSDAAYNPVMAKLDVGTLAMQGQDSLRLMLRGSSNTFRIHPSRSDRNLTVIGITSDNKRLGVKAGTDRLFASGLALKATATKAGKADAKGGAKTERRRGVRPSGGAPEWLSEADFRKSDISFDLGENLRSLYEAWNLDGSLKMNRVRVATPKFPLRTALTDFSGTITNDRITLDTLRLVSGASDVEASGEISNLRAVIGGRGATRLKLNIESDSLALSEMLTAYAKGQANMERDLSALSAMDDAGFEAALQKQSADTTAAQSSLIVVPANLNASIHLHGRKASYADMLLDDMHADILMKRRCLQIKDLVAASNIGTLTLDAFYSTPSKKNLMTGFDLGMHNVSAEGAISLVPQIDTLMPLLKSFGGLLNCSVAATAQLDTNMNLVGSSMDGILRITGRNLHIDESRELAKMARMLMFKEPRNIRIDTMSVEGVLKGENIEVFPFVMNVDRYCLAMAGVQRMDKSFNYHVSLIKSPLPVKLGANFYGSDFDHMKFKVGKALYRSPDVPVFSEVIDTTHLNLRTSIRNIFDKGVDRAVRENKARQNDLDAARKEQNYSQSAAVQSLDGLSDEEKRRYEDGGRQ